MKLKKEVGELRVQSINKDKEVAEVKTKEEDSWAIVAKKMKSHQGLPNLIGRWFPTGQPSITIWLPNNDWWLPNSARHKMLTFGG